MNAVQAELSVVFVIVVQSATVAMLESNVIAIKPTRTITAILILRITNHNQFDHSVNVYYISSPPFMVSKVSKKSLLSNALNKSGI